MARELQSLTLLTRHCNTGKIIINIVSVSLAGTRKTLTIFTIILPVSQLCGLRTVIDVTDYVTRGILTPTDNLLVLV